MGGYRRALCVLLVVVLILSVCMYGLLLRHQHMQIVYPLAIPSLEHNITTQATNTQVYTEKHRVNTMV